MVELGTSAHLTITPTTLMVAAGSQLALSVTLRNTGAAPDRYTLIVEGIPAAWCHVDRLSFPLDAGAVRHLPLIIHPPATAQPVGRVPLTVRVVSHHAHAVQSSATAALTVGPVDSLTMDVTPANAEGRAATYHVLLTNRSTRAASVTLQASDPEGRLRVRIEPGPTVLVPARGSATATVHARRAGGKRHPYAIEVELRAAHRGPPDAGNLALVRHLRFTDVPLVRLPQALTRRGWPRRRPQPTSAALFFALLALVVVAFVYALTVPEPVGLRVAAGAPASLPYIQQFQQHHAAGAPTVTLTWRVAAADTVTLNGRPVAATGTQSLARWDTNATYALRAANRQGAVVSRLTGAGARGLGTPTGPPRPRGPGISGAVSGGAGATRAGLGRSLRPGDNHSLRLRPPPRLVTLAPHRHRQPIVRAGQGGHRSRAPRRARPRAGPAVGPSSPPARRATGPCAAPRQSHCRPGRARSWRSGRRSPGAGGAGGSALRPGARGRRGGCGSSCRRVRPDAKRALRAGEAYHRPARAIDPLVVRGWAVIRRAIPPYLQWSPTGLPLAFRRRMTLSCCPYRR